MDFDQAEAAAKGFIKHWHLDGALFSNRSDVSWQTLTFVDRLLSNPIGVVVKAGEDPQAFRQVQQAAAQIFRLLHIAETEELEIWERESLSEIHIPKELYPWLANFLADPKAAKPPSSAVNSPERTTFRGGSQTFKRHSNRNYVIACAVDKLLKLDNRELLLAGSPTIEEHSEFGAVAKALRKLEQKPNSASGVKTIWYEVTGSGGFHDLLPNEPWFPEKFSK